MNVSASRDNSAIWARSSRAPNAQLRPMVRGFACCTEFQKAPGVWPDSSRPERSVIVPEIITGISRPRSSQISEMAKIAALALSVSKIVSIKSRSAPPSIKPRACSIEFVGDALHAVVGLGNGGRGKCVGGNDVGTGTEIGKMDGAHGVGTAEIEQIVVAPHLTIPRVEARAAIAFLAQLQRLDHGAHGTVEHKNALFEQTHKLGSYAFFGHYCATCLLASCRELTGLRPSRWQIAKTRSARFIV